MWNLKSATTQPARSTSTTLCDGTTVAAAATSSATRTPAMRCLWTRAPTTTRAASRAGHAPTVMATTRCGAVGTAATARPRASVAAAATAHLNNTMAAAPCRRAPSPPAPSLGRAQPHPARASQRWRSAYRVIGTGAHSERACVPRLRIINQPAKLGYNQACDDFTTT